ncbi:MAG: protein-L-isoaspartate(D-aspartate) O-methyltransferase [Candidatus Portnoybacteria bacterium]|nr:protein-L-isoaspartate(D-aspartate) O-methyltransferase [Candidatus Portnoybacteria bacterium]
MDKLINNLIKEGYLKTPLIIEAFKKIKRKDFLLEEAKSQANLNTPIHIGHGQTNSQPLTVAFMTELLQPKPGEKILDIGAGSGWQTAILAYCVKDKGKVYAIERIPELAEFGKNNIKKYSYIKKGIVKFICADGTKGLKEKAPFDKIIAAAATEELPQALKEQLKINGKIVIPIKNSIYLITKKSGTEFEEKEFPGFSFVPLIKDE